MLSISLITINNYLKKKKFNAAPVFIITKLKKQKKNENVLDLCHFHFTRHSRLLFDFFLWNRKKKQTETTN